MYGAQLIEALRRHEATTTHVGAAVPGCPPDSQSRLSFFGVGGERMRAVGCDTVVEAKDLSVVGITEILSHLPKIYSLFHKLITEADQRKPDLAIVLDSPAFNWRVARAMKKRKIPTVYYVAPQFWAWRQGRVRLLRKYIDKALVIFPFEERFYRERGVAATFVGHPLADLPYPAIARSDYAAQFHLDPAMPWITLMPGSRIKEVRMNLPTILEAAAQLSGHYEFLLPVAPMLHHSFLLNLIGRQKITLVPESLPALRHSRAGIVASGTATVEAAMISTPFVMVYRVTPLTYLLGQAAGQSAAFRNGQSDRGAGGRPRTGATQLHRPERRRPSSGDSLQRPGPSSDVGRLGPGKSQAARAAGRFGPTATPSRPRRRNHSGPAQPRFRQARSRLNAIS